MPPCYFDTDLMHASDIYDDPNGPKHHYFMQVYKFDHPSVAPKDKESGFFLIPLALI